MDPRSKTARIAQLRALIAAIPKYFGAQPLVVASTTYTAAELVAIFQRELDAILAIAVADAARAAVIAKERAAKRGNRRIHAAFRMIVEAMFSESLATLADFGYRAARKRKIKAETLALGLEKAKKTRAARGTMGKKQRKRASTSRS